MSKFIINVGRMRRITTHIGTFARFLRKIRKNIGRGVITMATMTTTTIITRDWAGLSGERFESPVGSGESSAQALPFGDRFLAFFSL